MRLSERISAAVTGGVVCPGCKKLVKPTLPAAEPATSDDPQGGKRWSFVWRDPSGEVCPECEFPLARYTKRLKWIRTFSLGVVLLTLAFLLYALDRMGDFPAWFAWVVRGAAVLGGVASLVGLTGLVIGGRSDAAGTSPPAV
ncbi:MAG: hypothetical protein JSW43_11655 [Gemmatimonadota bacterium]|nr:MAG: hypothetical protein JSW43_11655 [Gemmatimonadota bacterium]